MSWFGCQYFTKWISLSIYILLTNKLILVKCCLKYPLFVIISCLKACITLLYVRPFLMKCNKNVLLFYKTVSFDLHDNLNILNTLKVHKEQDNWCIVDKHMTLRTKRYNSNLILKYYIMAKSIIFNIILNI